MAPILSSTLQLLAREVATETAQTENQASWPSRNRGPMVCIVGIGAILIGSIAWVVYKKYTKMMANKESREAEMEMRERERDEAKAKKARDSVISISS